VKKECAYPLKAPPAWPGATCLENGKGVETGTVEAFILGYGRVVSVEALKQQAIGGA
jgi:hypothetical protein